METNDVSIKKGKRNFSRKWLADDRYKSWIRQVPEDDSLFYCSLCEKSFSCSSSHVLRHYESFTHKNINNQSNESKKLKKKEIKKKFVRQWLENEQFKPWLQEITNDPFSCYCTACQKPFSCGLTQINRHLESFNHIRNCEANGISVRKSNYDFDEQDEESLLSFTDQKNSAEVRYATLIAENNISIENAESILNFFKDIGKDPNILQNMTFSINKIALKNIKEETDT